MGNQSSINNQLTGGLPSKGMGHRCRRALHREGTPPQVFSQDSTWASPPLADRNLHPFPEEMKLNPEDHTSHELCDSFWRISNSPRVVLGAPNLQLNEVLRLLTLASQVALVVKNPPANAGAMRELGSIPGSGRSPGKGHGNLFQCFCLRNPMD